LKLNDSAGADNGKFISDTWVSSVGE